MSGKPQPWMSFIFFSTTASGSFKALWLSRSKKIKAQSFLIPGISRVETNNLVSLQFSFCRRGSSSLICLLQWLWSGWLIHEPVSGCKAPSEAALPFISTRWSLTYSGSRTRFQRQRRGSAAREEARDAWRCTIMFSVQPIGTYN